MAAACSRCWAIEAANGVSWTDDLNRRRQSFHEFGVGCGRANVVGYLGADVVGYSLQIVQPVRRIRATDSLLQPPRALGSAGARSRFVTASTLTAPASCG